MIIVQVRVLPTAIYLVDHKWNVFKLRGDLRLAALVVMGSIDTWVTMWSKGIITYLLPLIDAAPRTQIHRCRSGLLHPLNRGDHFLTKAKPHLTNDRAADLAYKALLNRRKRCR